MLAHAHFSSGLTSLNPFHSLLPPPFNVPGLTHRRRLVTLKGAPVVCRPFLPCSLLSSRRAAPRLASYPVAPRFSDWSTCPSSSQSNNTPVERQRHFRLQVTTSIHLVISPRPTWRARTELARFFQSTHHPPRLLRLFCSRQLSFLSFPSPKAPCIVVPCVISRFTRLAPHPNPSPLLSALPTRMMPVASRFPNIHPLFASFSLPPLPAQPFPPPPRPSHS